MANPFHGKRILITGGTGSFGVNFAKFLLTKAKPKKVIIFSRDELKQYHLARELDDPRASFFLGDVRDLPRLQRAFNGVDVVVHAAALKQVPALEYNPLEAIKTNIGGTQNVIEAAIDCEVPKVLFVSTDKAVQPVNLYGATKLCAERLCVSANAYSPEKTKFAVARYGNVVGSRGSIIDTLLRSQSAKVVHLTHPDMTRFWITLDEALDLVSFAVAEMQGGEIFIPKIPSMKITDLFGALAPDAKHKIIGIRPGEKIHEVLLTEHEARRTLDLKKYFVILPEATPWTTKDIYKKYRARGKKLAKDFTYASHTNDSWLTQKKLADIVKKLTPHA